MAVKNVVREVRRADKLACPACRSRPGRSFRRASEAAVKRRQAGCIAATRRVVSGL